MSITTALTLAIASVNSGAAAITGYAAIKALNNKRKGKGDAQDS